jgi:hypothetical protein
METEWYDEWLEDDEKKAEARKNKRPVFDRHEPDEPRSEYAPLDFND